jgi:hypothetical protein
VRACACCSLARIGPPAHHLSTLLAARLSCSALWNAALPVDARPADVDSSRWDPVWGDRCQEIVWIGIDMDEGALRAMLDGCLLTDGEMAQGPEGWAALEDPLPPWEVVIEEGEEGESEEGEEA